MAAAILMFASSCRSVQPSEGSLWHYQYYGDYIAHDMKTGKYRKVELEGIGRFAGYRLDLVSDGRFRLIIHDGRGGYYYSDGEWTDKGNYIILDLNRSQPDTECNEYYEALGMPPRCLTGLCIILEKSGKDKLRMKYSNAVLKVIGKSPKYRNVVV